MNYVPSNDVRFLAHIQLPGILLVNGSYYYMRHLTSTQYNIVFLYQGLPAAWFQTGRGGGGGVNLTDQALTIRCELRTRTGSV